MSDTVTSTRTLTSRILCLLLRHHLATTTQLRELLSANSTSAAGLDDRLAALHAQALTARQMGAWSLTADGVAVAGALPENTGRRLERPACPRTALALTGLGLSFARQHRQAYGRAPFSWDTPVLHRYRDRRGQAVQLEVAARVRTCHRTPAGLVALDGLVDVWPERMRQEGVGTRLRALASFAGGSQNWCEPGGPWRRWYPRVPHLLIATQAAAKTLDPLLEQVQAAARRESEIADLLSRTPVGLSSLGILDHHAAEDPVWISPIGRLRQVWTQLSGGIEVYGWGA